MKLKMFPPREMITQEGLRGNPETAIDVPAEEMQQYLRLGWTEDPRPFGKKLVKISPKKAPKLASEVKIDER